MSIWARRPESSRVLSSGLLPGYLKLDRRGAELLFQVFTERGERASIAIASNAAFSEWTATGTDSYRLRTATARHQATRT